MSDVARVPESRCLDCGALMNRVGTADRDMKADPHPGDIAICIRCGAVMMLDNHLRLRGMTDEEMNQLFANHELMLDIAGKVHRIHFIKHSTG